MILRSLACMHGLMVLIGRSIWYGWGWWVWRIFSLRILKTSEGCSSWSESPVKYEEERFRNTPWSSNMVNTAEREPTTKRKRCRISLSNANTGQKERGSCVRWGHAEEAGRILEESNTINTKKNRMFWEEEHSHHCQILVRSQIR